MRDPTVDEVLDRWTERLEGKGFLQLTLRCSRRTFDATDSKEVGEPWSEGTHIIAESSMMPDAFILLVWETDSKWVKKQEKPNLILGFVDGYVHERVWYAEQEQYRTLVFAAETAHGPRDCSYDGAGCQFGTLLVTWVGTTPGEYSARSSHDRQKPFSVIIDSPDPKHPAASVVRAQVPPDSEDGTIVYDRWDESYFDESGAMFQWFTTVYQGQHRPEAPYFILQNRFYEYEFSDHPSDRASMMIELTRTKINEWLREQGG